MTMNINEKKAICAFGCPNREATVQRFAVLASLTPDPEAKKFFVGIARKLKHDSAESWYSCFYYNLRLEMETYFKAEKCMEIIERSTEHEEDDYAID